MSFHGLMAQILIFHVNVYNNNIHVPFLFAVVSLCNRTESFAMEWKAENVEAKFFFNTLYYI